MEFRGIRSQTGGWAGERRRSLRRYYFIFVATKETSVWDVSPCRLAFRRSSCLHLRESDRITSQHQRQSTALPLSLAHHPNCPFSTLFVHTYKHPHISLRISSLKMTTLHITILRNFHNYLPVKTAWHPRRLESSAIPLCLAQKRVFVLSIITASGQNKFVSWNQSNAGRMRYLFHPEYYMSCDS